MGGSFLFGQNDLLRKLRVLQVSHDPKAHEALHKAQALLAENAFLEWGDDDGRARNCSKATGIVNSYMKRRKIVLNEEEEEA